MLSSELKWKLTGAGIFALPIVLVKGAAVVLNAPTVANSAAAIPASPDITLIEGSHWSPKWTEEQITAAEHVAALDAEVEFCISPLYHAETEEPEPEVEDPQNPSAPPLVVGAILYSRTGSTALINGRPYRVGDRIEGCRWEVAKIDGQTRTVMIRDPETGDEVQGSVSRITRPGIRNAVRSMRPSMPTSRPRK